MEKMDEMELQTRAVGIKWAWFFLVLALGTWTAIELTQTGSLPLAGLLLVTQFLIYFTVVSIQKRRMGDDRTLPSALLFGIIALTVVGFGVIAWFMTK